MKLSDPANKQAKKNIISDVLRATIESISSLLTWIKMLFIVGFVIIAVVILGGLLDVLVRLSNYKNGTQLQTGQILKSFLIFSVMESIGKISKKSNSQKSS